MNEETVEVEIVGEDEAGEEERPLGQVSIYRSMDPMEQLKEAQDRAAVLVQVINAQGLSKTFGNSQKPHVFVEGWQFLASQFGLVPDIEWTRELAEGPRVGGWEARAALIRLSDGQVIAHADAECRNSETNWKNRPSYALRSMAQTRAVSKVCRIALSSVMVMAGYSATPAEEMDFAVPREKAKRRQPTRIDTGPTTSSDDGTGLFCPACQDQLGTLVPVTGPHDKKPYWRCTADPADCGGFRVYNGKEYSWSGWRTDFDNAVAEYRSQIVKDDPQTAVIGNGDERQQRSDYIVDEVMALTGLTNRVDASMLIKPGLVYAISEGNVDAEAALGGPPSDPVTDDELRVIAVNLTLGEADEVIGAAATLAAPFSESTDEEAEARSEMSIQEGDH